MKIKRLVVALLALIGLTYACADGTPDSLDGGDEWGAGGNRMHCDGDFCYYLDGQVRGWSDGWREQDCDGECSLADGSDGDDAQGGDLNDEGDSMAFQRPDILSSDQTDLADSASEGDLLGDDILPDTGSQGKRVVSYPSFVIFDDGDSFTLANDCPDGAASYTVTMGNCQVGEDGQVTGVAEGDAIALCVVAIDCEGDDREPVEVPIFSVPEDYEPDDFRAIGEDHVTVRSGESREFPMEGAEGEVTYELILNSSGATVDDQGHYEAGEVEEPRVDVLKVTDGEGNIVYVIITVIPEDAEALTVGDPPLGVEPGDEVTVDPSADELERVGLMDNDSGGDMDDLEYLSGPQADETDLVFVTTPDGQTVVVEMNVQEGGLYLSHSYVSVTNAGWFTVGVNVLPLLPGDPNPNIYDVDFFVDVDPNASGLVARPYDPVLDQGFEGELIVDVFPGSAPGSNSVVVSDGEDHRDTLVIRVTEPPSTGLFMQVQSSKITTGARFRLLIYGSDDPVTVELVQNASEGGFSTDGFDFTVETADPIVVEPFEGEAVVDYVVGDKAGVDILRASSGDSEATTIFEVIPRAGADDNRLLD